MTFASGPSGPSPVPDPPRGGPSLGHLVSQMSEQTARLVRAEIDLAKAELAEKAKAAGIGIGLLAAAGFLGFFAFGVLLTVVILALCEAFAPWLAALIVLGAMLLIIGVLALVGIKKLQQGVPPTPQKAIDGVKADADAVSSAVKEGFQR
ncbi:phage holin family protein [Cellulomonas sp. NPDC089187]|uniref:phage holin family protein n=1 Tax=Cellulomonas sp. NPDC089187 TaxID=3154970 RepID=UPI003439CBD3